MRRPVARLLCSTALFLSMTAYRAEGVSFEEEREMGRRFALAARIPILNDPDVVEYLESVGRRVAGALEDSVFEYHFFVPRDPRANAFAVPGGFVYVNAGLLGRVQSEDELAAVLAHEVAHVNAHHIARQQEASQLLGYAQLLGMLASVVQPAVGAVTAAANSSVQLRYRRELEQEADYLAVPYLEKAGYDPAGLADFFERLLAEQRREPSSPPPYLLSHPLTDERIHRLQSVLRARTKTQARRSAPGFRLRRAQALAQARLSAPGEAVVGYRNLVQAHPSDPVLRYFYGLVCLESGDLDCAGPALQEARDNGVPEAEREMGRLALRRQRPGEARAALQRAVEREPGDALAQYELGRAQQALGDTAAAIEAYRRAVAASSQMDAAHYELGVLAGRSGDEAGGFYHVATASRLRGALEQALHQYARAEALLPAVDPRRAECRAWIGDLSEVLDVRAPTPAASR